MKESILTKNKKDLRNIAKNILVTVMLGVCLSLLAYILLNASLFNWDWLRYQEHLINQSKRVTVFEMGILFFIYIWLTFLLRSKWGATSLFVVFAASLSIANQQKMIMRGEPIYPSDIDMVRVIPELLGMIDLKIALLSIVFVVVMLFLTIFLIRKEWIHRRKETNDYSLTMTILLVIVSLGFIVFYNFNKPENMVRASFDPYVQWINWSQQRNYQKNGFVAGFLYNMPGQSIDKPANYSTDNLEEIVGKYMGKAEKYNESLGKSSEINPNILFVMNESFSDPDNLDEIKLSANPLPYFKRLTNDYLSGNVLVPGYGGGTANAEFEALTSIAMEPLATNISTPYIQMSGTMSKIPNIISYLKDKNYCTTAIHPYNTTMYKRPDVYSALGFDHFIYDETMQSMNSYEKNSHISDLSSYEEVLYQMAKTREKDFIHLVTMHGHTPYENNYEKPEFKVENKSSNEDIEMLEQYYQGLFYSDQDLEYLIKQIDLIEEDTLLVFWGDHLPGIYTDDIFTKQHEIDKYEAPVLFYANFESEELNEKLSITSPFYFMNIISDILKEPISGYTAFMKEMQNSINAFKRGRYAETSTKSIVTDRRELTEESQELLNEYDIILYDLLAGSQRADELGFYENSRENH